MNIRVVVNLLTSFSLIVFSATIAILVFRDSKCIEMALVFSAISSAAAFPFIRAFFFSNMGSVERYCEHHESRYLISIALGDRFLTDNSEE